MNENIQESVVVRPENRNWRQGQDVGVEEALLESHSWESFFLRFKSSVALSAGLPRSQGEEYLVLSGWVESGGKRFSTGSYLRFPADSSAEKSELRAGEDGAVLFRKLFRKIGHVASLDTSLLSINPQQSDWRPGLVPGLSVMPLHQFGHESAALVRWGPNTQFNPHTHPGGEEIVVLAGTFHDENGSYPTGSWIRNRPYSQHTPFTGQDGALIFVKTGHLKLGNC